jgi:hypothetical protein
MLNILVDDQWTRSQQYVVQTVHVGPVGTFSTDDHVPYASFEILSRS